MLLSDSWQTLNAQRGCCDLINRRHVINMKRFKKQDAWEKEWVESKCIAILHWVLKRGEKNRVMSIKLLSYRGMASPARLTASTTLVQEVFQRGVHSADDHIIYRWKRILNRAINAQMRPGDQMTATWSAEWDVNIESGQVQPSIWPLKQICYLMATSITLTVEEEKISLFSAFARIAKWTSMTAEELWPFGQIHQGGLPSCFHIWTHSCTQAPSQILRYHQSGDGEISTRPAIRSTCDGHRGAWRSKVGPWGVH